MRIIVIIIGIMYAELSYSQTDLVDEYATLFRVEVREYKGKTYVLRKINTVSPHHKLAGLINENQLYVNYILLNYSEIEIDSLVTFFEKKYRYYCIK